MSQSKFVTAKINPHLKKSYLVHQNFLTFLATHRNTKCTYQGPKPTKPAKVCEQLCGHIIYYHAGKCQVDKYGRQTGRCLCWWGWTGPGAQFRADGRIVADYCVLPCYYTKGFHNRICARAMD